MRSARTTDAQLLPLFGKPGLVYSGANGRVQRKLDGASLVPVFRLTRDRRRVAPHNVFVDLRQVARTEKLGKAQPIGWTFADKPSQGGRPDDTATSKVGNDTFGFAYAKGRYTVTWRGARYVDGDNDAVTQADNVVIMRVRNVPDGNRDVLGSASVLSETVGRGKVTHLPRRGQDRRHLVAEQVLRAAALHRPEREGRSPSSRARPGSPCRADRRQGERRRVVHRFRRASYAGASGPVNVVPPSSKEV